MHTPSKKNNNNWLMISEARPGLREDSRVDVALKFTDSKAKRKKKRNVF